MGLSIRDGRDFVQKLLALIRDDLKTTGRSELRGLGTFAVHTRPARDTVHPTSGKPVHIPQRKAVRYRASKELKDVLNDSTPSASSSPPGSVSEAREESID